MGRKRLSHSNLPTRVYFSKGWYFYAEPKPGGKWHKLGREFDLNARLKWAELTGHDVSESRGDTVKKMLADFIQFEEARGKRAANTIRDYKKHSEWLNKVFGKMGPNEVTSIHIARYLDKRKSPDGKLSPIRANREMSTLSSAFSYGMRQGVARINPTYGVKRNEEEPEQYAPELWEVRAVQRHAKPKWAAAIELALLVGQRGIDMRKLTRQDARDEGIYFKQTKRGAQILVEWTPELAAAWQALENATRGNKTPSIYMIPSNRGGQPFTDSGWGSSFDKIVNRAINAGDIPKKFGFHAIRAANATIDDAQGGKPQKRLGHSTEQQTADYIRPNKPTKVQPLRTNYIRKTS